MTEAIIAVAAAAGIPSAAVGFFMWLMQRKILKREKQKELEEDRRRKEREEREKDRELFEIHLIESVNAAMALSEATAKAVQRIPEAHCNGDMHAALNYAKDVKNKQKDFLLKKGVQSII